MVLRKINWELRNAATAQGPTENSLRRMIAIGEHMCEFHRGLPSHHRKWFYECQGLVWGESARNQFYGALADLHGEWQRAAMMRKMDETHGIHFEINQSQIGTLNLGTIIGDVESKLTTLSGPKVEELKGALIRLTEAAIEDGNLGQEAMRELIESISVLADEANKEPDHRRGAIVRSVMQTISAIASSASGVALVWSEVEPLIHAFFG